MLAGAGFLGALVAYRFVRANPRRRASPAPEEPSPPQAPAIDVALSPGTAPGAQRLEVMGSALISLEIVLRPVMDRGAQALAADGLVGDERRIYE